MLIHILNIYINLSTNKIYKFNITMLKLKIIMNMESIKLHVHQINKKYGYYFF